MSFFSSKNKHKQNILVIEIGGTDVSGAVASFEPDEKLPCAVITKVARRPIMYGDPVNLKRYTQSIADNIDQVLHELIPEITAAKPEKFFCFLPSTLCQTATKTLLYQGEKPFVVTPKIIGGLTAKYAKDWVHDNEVLYTDIPGDGNELIETHIMNIKLNGYEVKDPYKKRAEKVELQVYTSLGSRSILQMIRERMSAVSSGQPVVFATTAIAQFQVLAEILPLQKDYLLIDPSGELCDVLFVSGGVLLNQLSFPLGKNTIIHQTAILKNSVSSAVESNLSLYSQGQLLPTETGAVNQNLEALRLRWNDLFSQTLQNITEQGFVPNKVVVIDDDPLSTIFVPWIENPDFEKYTLARKPLMAEVVTPATLASFCGTMPGAREEMGLAFDLLFARRFVK